MNTNTIRESIHNSILSVLGAADASHPKYPTTYYLDPQDAVIRWYTQIGSGIPAAAYHGIWVRIFQAPANAIPESIVKTLLGVEDLLARDCEDNFSGVEWDGHNYVGVWKDRPDYSVYSLESDVVVFWSAEDWFEPVLQDLKRKWESGMSVAQIIDSEDLGDIHNGMTDRNQAIEWLETKIQEWQEAA